MATSIDLDYIAHLCGAAQYHLKGIASGAVKIQQGAPLVNDALSAILALVQQAGKLPQVQTGVQPFNPNSPEATLAAKLPRMKRQAPPVHLEQPTTP